MLYLLLTAGVFLADFAIKRRMDKKYARMVTHSRLGGRILIEKYYNKGAALNFLARKPELMRGIHTGMLIVIGIFYYFLLRCDGRKIEKTGVAMLLGGGLSNLYDRYTKGHVVDYFHINRGPEWFRRIIFNVSDFCVFIGTLLAVVGMEEKQKQGGERCDRLNRRQRWQFVRRRKSLRKGKIA